MSIQILTHLQKSYNDRNGLEIHKCFVAAIQTDEW